MARTVINGKDGLATLTGHVFGVDAWGMRVASQVEPVPAYGDTGYGAAAMGSGIGVYSFTMGGFAVKDAAGAVKPHFDVLEDVGTALVLQAFTGCTETGVGIVSAMSIGHQKNAAKAPIAFEGMFNGAPTEAWVST